MRKQSINPLSSNMKLFPEVTDPIRQMCATTNQEVQKLRTKANELARTAQVWCDFVQYMEKDWPMHLLMLVSKETALLKRMRAENHPAVAPMEEAYRLAKDSADNIIRRFPMFLERACLDRKIPLDTDSRHPNYSFERGFFQLKINEKTYTAQISDHEGRLAQLPADIQAIIELIQKEHERVFGRSYNGLKFLKSLRSQYKAVIKKTKQPDGSSVPIRHITRRLGKRLKGFRTDEFLVDLSRLVQEGPFEIDGRRLDLQQTKDTSQGMLLHGAAGRGYIGFILFKEV